MHNQQKITQSEIDDLLKDSQFEESSLNQLSNLNNQRNVQAEHEKQAQNIRQAKDSKYGDVRQSNYSYGDEEFQNYSQSQAKVNMNMNVNSANNNKFKNESQSYGDDNFQSYDQSRQTVGKVFSKKVITNTNVNTNNNNPQYSQSYGNESFQNYEQSRKIEAKSKQFERSSSNKKNEQKQKPKSKSKQIQNELTAIRQQKSVSKDKNKRQPPIGHSSKHPIIKIDTVQKNSPNKATIAENNNNNNSHSNNNNHSNNKSTKPMSKTMTHMATTNSKPNEQKISNHNPNHNQNLPYKYDKLQQRQKQLLFTTITQQNKALRQQLSSKDKQLQQIKLKYNLLMQEKTPQAFSNAKEATMNKKLLLLQEKYNVLLKQRERERQTEVEKRKRNFGKSMMAKTMTMNNNFVGQFYQQTKTRQDELNSIIDKLKQRLISTDKQLKTLQAKMNQGLDYTQELQRKLKRVEQLQFKLQKMKNQAQTDRLLIQNFKQKTKEQTLKIQQLKKQKIHLEVCLKRAQMSGSTNQDIIEQLQEMKRQKDILQKSLRDLTFNFSNSLKPQRVKSPPKEVNADFEDSEGLLKTENENINRSSKANNVNVRTSSPSNNSNSINAGSSSKPKFYKKI